MQPVNIHLIHKTINMKKINCFALVILMLLSAVNNTHAQRRPLLVPEAVKTTFAGMNPTTSVQEWEYNKKKQWYIAEYMLNNTNYESIFSTDGKWLRTEKNITQAELPQPVLAAIAASAYAGWKTDEAEEHQTPEHALIYVVEVEKGRKEMELYFLPGGQLLQTIKK